MKLFANIKGTKQVDIPELGIWIKVREELSVGERRKIFADAFKGQTELSDGKVRNEYDAQKLSFGLVIGHLVDWNASQEVDGKITPVDCDADAIQGLTDEAFNVIEKAVNEHIKGVKEPGEATPAQKSGPKRSNVATISSSVAG